MLVLGCDAGLFALEKDFTPLPCPLRPVTHVASLGKRLITVDDTHHLLWTGQRVIACDRGLTMLMMLRHHLLTLSGETDALTLWDADGNRLISAHAGVYPTGMCPLADGLAVCGGAEGKLLLFTLPGLHPAGSVAVPGICQQVCPGGRGVYILCLVGHEVPSCLLCRWVLRAQRYQPVAELPGLPGALTPDGFGGCWAAAGEALYHFPAGKSSPDATVSGFGLIHHLTGDGQHLYCCDGLMDACYCVPTQPPYGPILLYRGAAGQTALMETGTKKDAPRKEVRP